MASIFKIKRNDTLPTLDVKLKDSLTTYMNLNVSGLTVNFSMKEVETGIIQINSASASIIDPDTGSVQYQWVAGNTSTAGVYYGEFELLYEDGNRLTFPTDSSLIVNIYEDINNV